MSLSQKQVESLRDSNAKINIWEGAVRSGKTYVSLWRFLKELTYGPAGEYAVIARTYDSFKRNVLPQLTRMIGADAKYYKGSREMNIWGKTIHIVGADDERAESKIRGPTFSGAYVDEATIIPESVFKMLISRCAMGGARIFGTTNPDSPYHWLKRDYLTDNPDVKSWQFRLEDNPELTDFDREYLIRQYKGLWYQRFILGLWVQAEGAVYDFFDEKVHVIKHAPGYTNSYIIGVDYGTTNPCAFILIGIDFSRFPNVWVEDEYYFDSRVHQRQKTDSEYADDFRRFVGDRPIQAVYIDPSAVSFRLELQKRGQQNLYQAKNDVLDGIRFVGQYLGNGTLKVCQKCTNLLKEFASYVWDSNSFKSGEDKPLKQNDHCFPEGTKILTNRGYISIEKIFVGDYVKTRSGFNRVLSRFKNYSLCSEYNILGKKILCTDNHPFLTINGWKEASSLIQSDMFFIETQGLPWMISSNSTVSNIDVINELKTLVIGDITERINQIASKDLDISIEIFGNSILEKFHKDTIFITRTGIRSTMILAISDVFWLKSTYPCMEKILQKIREKDVQNISIVYGIKQKFGIDLKREENGIQNMPKIAGNLLKEKSFANNAVKNTRRSKKGKQDFARIVVSLHGEELLTLIMNLENVFFAENDFSVINTPKTNSAQSLVLDRNFGERTVYNLHIENENEYVVDGILVHNCMDALRYAVYTHFFGRDGKKMTAKDIDDLWKETTGQGSNLPRFFQDDDFGMR